MEFACLGKLMAALPLRDVHQNAARTRCDNNGAAAGQRGAAERRHGRFDTHLGHGRLLAHPRAGYGRAACLSKVAICPVYRYRRIGVQSVCPCCLVLLATYMVILHFCGRMLAVMYDAPCGPRAGGDDEDGIVSLSSDLAATRNVVVAVSHNDCRVWDFVQGRLLHGLPYSSVCKAALALLLRVSLRPAENVVPQEMLCTRLLATARHGGGA
jgi:hypothetical protein